jgi:hypothetical protein
MTPSSPHGYRTPDEVEALREERDTLRERVRELEARPKKAARPWTKGEREASQVVVGGGSAVTAAILVLVASSWVVDCASDSHGGVDTVLASRADIHVGLVLYALAVPFAWVLLRLVTGHWDWWHGIGGDT